MSGYDVIIAGYGPTGAVAANLLGAMGLQVLVLEPNLDIYAIPRAVHIDGEVMRIFQSMDLAEDIATVAADAVGLRFTNGRNWPLFYQDMSKIDRPNGWATDIFFNQPLLEQHLRAGVARHGSVEVRSGHALTDLIQHGDHVEITAQHLASGDLATERCSYLLACDGATSPVRGLMQIDLQDLHCDEPWLVCDLLLEEGSQHNRDCYQICDPARPTTLVPCEGSHIRWEFMVNPGDDAAELESEATARSMMAPHMHRLAPGLSADSGKLIRSKVYNFHALLAETFQTGRVFLLGDAAHQTPPFLGQGLCAGVRDAYNLCWKLAGVLQGSYAPALLDTYTSERRPQVYEVITTAVKHGAIIQARNPLKALLRDCYLMLGHVFPPLAGFLSFGEGWSLGPGLLACRGAPEVGSPLGRPLPQRMVQTRRGELQRLDELLGEEFTVVGFGIDPAVGMDMPRSLSCLYLGPEGEAQDVDGNLSSWSKTHNIAIALVRPDRQVYGICEPGHDADVRAQLSALLAQLQRQISSPPSRSR